MSLRILRLEIENVKKIKVLSIEPKGNVIKVTGANGSGKTSTLDAIYLALVGARGGPKVPVRVGAERGQVRVDLGEYVVTRQWYAGGSSKGEMWIEATDGRRYGTPQAVLDAAMGKISFDPLAFLRMEPNHQADEMRKLLDLDEPLSALKVEYDTDYATRREVKKELDEIEAQRKVIVYPADLPAKRRNVDAMIEDLAKIGDHNMAIERDRILREKVADSERVINQQIVTRAGKIEALRLQIDELEAETERDRESLENIDHEKSVWKALPEPKDAAKLSADISAARGINAAIDARERAERLDKEIAEKAATVTKLSTAIDTNREKAQKLIAEAKYPFPGLGFNDGEVLYNGLPLDQASDAQRTELSVAIAMYGNPKLRVMRIKDGSLLDDTAQKIIEDMAEKHDYQVWMEVMNTSGKMGVYLVDGEVQAIDGEPLKEQPQPTLKAARKPRERAQL